MTEIAKIWNLEPRNTPTPNWFRQFANARLSYGSLPTKMYRSPCWARMFFVTHCNSHSIEVHYLILLIRVFYSKFCCLIVLRVLCSYFNSNTHLVGGDLYDQLQFSKFPYRCFNVWFWGIESTLRSWEVNVWNMGSQTSLTAQWEKRVKLSYRFKKIEQTVCVTFCENWTLQYSKILQKWVVKGMPVRYVIHEAVLYSSKSVVKMALK